MWIWKGLPVCVCVDNNCLAIMLSSGQRSGTIDVVVLLNRIGMEQKKMEKKNGTE